MTQVENTTTRPELAPLAELRARLRPSTSAKRFDSTAFVQLCGLPPNTTFAPFGAEVSETKPARTRKPSLARTIKQAEKAAGKPVTSVTLPDGTKLAFGEPEPTEATNAWLAKLKKVGVR